MGVYRESMELDVFFTRKLPAVLRLCGDNRRTLLPRRVQFSITGEGGGAWVLDLAEGTGDVVGGRCEQPDVTVETDTASLREIVRDTDWSLPHARNFLATGRLVIKRPDSASFSDDASLNAVRDLVYLARMTTKSADDWHTEYQSGRWAYMRDSIDEQPRSAIVAGYINGFFDNPTILDVGCGYGQLRRFLKPFRRYVGLDISAAAVEAASEGAEPGATFIATPCDEWLETAEARDSRFDVIVFSEVLMCLSDPFTTVRNYARLLAPEGNVIISMVDQNPATPTILSGLETFFVTRHEAHVSTPSSPTWKYTFTARMLLPK